MPAHKKKLALNKLKGFTLIELLVVIAIITVLSIIGIAVFSSFQKTARDTARKTDIASIAKAYELNFAGQYQVLSGTEFTKGEIPTPPEGGNYSGLINTSASSFQICTALEGHTGPCDSLSETCFCIQSRQGNYSAGAGGTPTPTPPIVSTPTPTPTPTLMPTATPTPTPILCSLTSASWSTISATVGDTVYLNVAGANCDGQIINFEVREADPGIIFDLSDPVNINPAADIFIGNNAQSSWVAEWQEDGLFGAGNPPEYFFRASSGISSIESPSGVGNELVVNSVPTPSPTPTPTPAITPTPTLAPTPTPTSAAPQTVIFQRGSANSYSTTIDCILVAIEVNTCGTQNLNLTNNGSSPQDAAVIKFPDMFGSNAGQIPPNSAIVSAELELTIGTVDETDPDVSVHQILEDWSASAVANYSPTRTRRIGGGSSVDWTNSGAGLPTSSNSIPADTKNTSGLSAVSFNIGNIVSNWSANTNNNRGVVLRHSSFTDTSNTFRSSEYGTVANRPKLTVTFTPP